MKVRSYYRQPVIQNAVLKLPEIGELPCEIRNFCQAGLFLQVSIAENGFSLPEKETTAEVVFTPSGKEVTFRLGGKLSHVSANGTGFVFTLRPPYEVLQALHEKTQPKPFGKMKLSEQHRAIHQRCLQIFENTLTAVLNNLSRLSNAELDKNPRSRVGGGPVPQLKSQCVERFYAHAMEQANSFVVPDLSMHPEAGVVHSTSKQQRALFEDWVNLVEKANWLETQYAEPLSQLAKRLGRLVDKEMADHENPFGPSVLMHSFQYSIQSSGLDNLQRNIVYEVLARLLNENFKTLLPQLLKLTEPLVAQDRPQPWPKAASPQYGNATGRLAQPQEGRTETTGPVVLKSILPEPQTPVANPENSAPARSWGKVGAASSNHRPSAFNAYVFLSRYAEYQSARLNTLEEADGEFDPAPLLDALAELLDGNNRGVFQYFTAPKLLTSLRQILGQSGQEGLLSHIEARQTLQLVGLLLDTILLDANTPQVLMPYFQKLQLPLMIAAFSDPLLLDGTNHPALEMLNQLSLVTLATNSRGEINNSELAQALGAIIDDIGNGVWTNPQIFTEALATLEKLTMPLARTFAMRLERVVETSAGGHRLDQARRRVDREMDLRIAGKTVPAIVPILLDCGWRQSLVLTNLRMGADSEEWRRQLAVVDLLLSKTAQPSIDKLEKPVDIVELQTFVKEKLYNLGTDPPVINRVVEDIGKIISEDRRMEVEMQEVPMSDSMREERESLLRIRLQGFKVGDWLKFNTPANPGLPLRLTWIGQEPPRYVFVNQRGVKTEDLDAVAFAQILDAKQARRIESLEELSLVERTAKSLLYNLRDRLR